MQPNIHFSTVSLFPSVRAAAFLTLRRFRLLAVYLVYLTVSIANGAPSSAPLGKSIYQYALTSANDFPQRDPQDWRLLGSNDGGKTWATLDSRKDEHFSARHQRRLFKVSRPAKFEIYRVEIDKVLDRKVANSVQLAEIELMGETESDLSPVPVFTDIITSQGDNPPAETVAKLFDGRVETKWLDRPTNRLTCASWVQWQYTSPTGTLITNISRLLALRARADGGYPLQIEGTMMEVREYDTGKAPVKNGQRVLVQGASQRFGNAVTVGQVQVRHRDQSPRVAPERISLEQPLQPADDLKWVEIEGTIEFRSSASTELCFEVRQGESSMRVRIPESSAPGELQNALRSLPQPGTRVTVKGICRAALNDQGEWVAADLWAPGFKAISTVNADGGPNLPSKSPQNKSPGNLAATITKIEQIRRLNPQQLNSRPPVKIKGVVTELLGGFLQDDTAGIQVAFPDEQSRKLTEPGMFVEVEGFGGTGDVGNPIVSAEKVTVLGKGKLPQPQRLSGKS